MKLKLITTKAAKKILRKRRLKKFLIFSCAILLLILGITTYKRCTREIEWQNATHKLTLRLSSTYDSVQLDIINSTSESYLKYITAIEFGEGTDLDSYSVTTREFFNLNSNTLYTVKVYYRVPLENGDYETKILTRTILTKPKAKPSFSLTVLDVSDTDISAILFVHDSNSTMISYKTELYLSNELVAESDMKDLHFTDLIPRSTYLLKVSATYDRSDGKGVVEEAMIKKVVKTPPSVTVSDVTLLSGEIVKENESVLLQLTLDNPHNVHIYGAVINGTEVYTVEESGTDSVYVEIPYKTVLKFGDDEIELKIEQLFAKHETFQYCKKLNTVTVSVKLEENMKVEKLEFVNGDLTTANRVTDGEQIYVLVTLKNPNAGVITSAKVSGRDEAITDIVKLDNERWLIPVYTNTDKGWHTVSLESIIFEDEFAETTVTLNKDFSYVVTDQDTVHYVSTAEDLKNMNDGYYYELTGDIDLSGIAWSGVEFNGFLNGCGYSIRNMSCIANVKNQSAYLGLFSTAEGTVANLVIENATIILKINEQEEGDFAGYCGGVAAYASNLTLISCYVDGTSAFSLGATLGTPVYCGGLIGAGSATVINSQSAARLSSSMYCGGIIGASTDSQTKIIDSYNSGNVSVTGIGADFFVGGIIGYGHFDITDSYNSGSVTGNTFTSVHGAACVGGIAGAGYGRLENSYNTGAVLSDVHDTAYTGGLVGRLTEASEIKHSYNTGNVRAKFISYAGYTGGLVGVIDKNASISTSYSSGKIECETANNKSATVGGIIGALMYGVVDISDCYTEGELIIIWANNGYAGGIIGHTLDPTLTVSNCYSTCSMNMRYGNFFCAGGILGTNEGTIVVTNVFTDCYASLEGRNPTAFHYIVMIGFSSEIDVFNSYYVTKNNTLLDLDGNTPEYGVKLDLFYTDILGWSEDVWDFSVLSEDEMRYPVLK